MTETFTLDQIEALRAIARAGSFSAAAEELYLTQPAMSQRIRHLERSLGAVIFDRSRAGHPLRLTQAGECALKFADQLAALLERLRRDIASCESEEKRESLALACSPMAAKYILPSLLSAYHEQFPGGRLRLVQCDAGKIDAMVRAGEVDFGVEPSTIISRGMGKVRLVRDRLVLIGRIDDVPPVEWTVGGYAGTCRSYPFVLTPDGTNVRRITDAWASSISLTMDVVIESFSFDMLKEAVREGLGFSLVSEHVLSLEPEPSEIRVIEAPGLPYERDLCLVYDRGVRMTKGGAAFLEVAAKTDWRTRFPKISP